MEVAGAADAKNRVPAPWKTTEQVFHSSHRPSSSVCSNPRTESVDLSTKPDQAHIWPTPCEAARLTAREWQGVLREAERCLQPNGDRAVQLVTLMKTHVRRHLEVCPHLNIGRPLWKSTPSTSAERLHLVRKVAEELKAIHGSVMHACKMRAPE